MAPISPLNAGVYFVVADDGSDFLVIGIVVDDNHAWVAGRWTTRAAADADAARWTALELEAA